MKEYREKKKQRERDERGEKGGCFKGEGLRNALLPALSYTHTLCMQTPSPSLALTVSSVMSSRCAAENGGGWVRVRREEEGPQGGGGVGVGGLPCMSCAEAWRDTVRGDAVSTDGVAGQGPGARTGEEEESQKDLHIWNHFRSAWALAMKGETGRLAGERGRQGSDTGHTTVRDQGNNRQQELKRLQKKHKKPFFMWNTVRTR